MAESQGKRRGYRGKGTVTVSSSIYATLKSDIVTCRLRPGEMVFESELAERFEASKAPVREALKQLTQEGLIESRPSVGHFVAPVTLEDVRELFQLRQILEAAVVTEAARVATAEQLARIESLVGEVYTLDSESARIRWHHQNVAFHVAVAQVLQNGRLARTVQSAVEGMSRIEYVNLSFQATTAELVKEHQEIAAALRSRDGKRAAEVAEAALDRWLRLVQQSLHHWPAD